MCWRLRASRGAYWLGSLELGFDLHFLCVFAADEKRRRREEMKTENGSDLLKVGVEGRTYRVSTNTLPSKRAY